MVSYKLYRFYGIEKNDIYGTALHTACGKGQIEVVKYLLSLDKININAKNILILNYDKVLK